MSIRALGTRWLTAKLLKRSFSTITFNRWASPNYHRILGRGLSKPHHIGSGLAPHVSAAARVGDIRHCTADNAAAGAAFGYAPAAGLTEGLGRLIADGSGDHPAAGLMAARHELAQAGLLR